MFEPGSVDPERFCRQSGDWKVDSSLSEFPRLGQEFTQGQLACRVSGSIDSQGGHVLHIEISGELVLTCQRCLGNFPLAIAIEHEVLLANSGTELERRDADSSCSSDVILMEHRMSLIELIEDEVLLGLPLSPMHEPGECALPAKIT